jgi:hypothetical protein
MGFVCRRDAEGAVAMSSVGKRVHDDIGCTVVLAAGDA